MILYSKLPPGLDGLEGTDVTWVCSPCVEQSAGSHSFMCQLGWDVCTMVVLQKPLQSG